ARQYPPPPAQSRYRKAARRTARARAARSGAQPAPESTASEARARSAGGTAADRCTGTPAPPVHRAVTPARTHRDRDKRDSVAYRPARVTRQPSRTAPRCGPATAERTSIKEADASDREHERRQGGTQTSPASIRRLPSVSTSACS